MTEPPSERLWKTWPRSGSMRNGTCSARPRSGHPIAGSGCSYWPTATALDAVSATRVNRSASSGAAVRPILSALAAMWPTPTSEDAESTGHRPLAESTGATTLTAASRQWRTPRAPSPRSGGPSASRLDHDHPYLDLQDQAAQWATPTVSDADRRTEPQGDREGSPGLTHQASLWATPMAPNGGRAPADGRSPTGMLPDGRKRQVGLEWQTSMWATPSAQMWRSEAADQSPDHSPPLSRQVLRTPTPGRPSSPSARTSRPRLNPAFVEWLMGWPLGWSGCEPLGTEWSRWWRLSRSWLWRLVPGSPRAG